MSYSPAPLAAEERKPSPWNVEAQLVDPFYKEYWRGLRLLIPFWEGSGSAYDWVTHTELTAEASQEGWTPTDTGVASKHSGVTSSAWVIPSAIVPDATELTLLVFTEWDGQSPVGNQQLANHGATTAGTWALFYEDTPDFNGQVRVDGGTARIAQTTGAPTDDKHVFAITYKDPDLTLYDNGQSVATESTGGVLDTDQGDMYIGDHPSADNSWSFPIRLVAVWDRALTASEVETVSANPMGLLYPNWDYFAAAGVVKYDNSRLLSRKVSLRKDDDRLTSKRLLSAKKVT